MRRASARGCWCSSVLAEEDKQGKAEPELVAPDHERRRRGGAMAAEDSCRNVSSCGC
jgi:hypothetical protein